MAESGNNPPPVKAVALRVSSALLLIFFGLYLALWLHNNWAAPDRSLVQTDDVRQHVFAFHRYGPEKALSGDPTAEEWLAASPLLIRSLYAFLDSPAGPASFRQGGAGAGLPADHCRGSASPWLQAGRPGPGPGLSFHHPAQRRRGRPHGRGAASEFRLSAALFMGPAW